MVLVDQAKDINKRELILAAGCLIRATVLELQKYWNTEDTDFTDIMDYNFYCRNTDNYSSHLE